MILINLFGAPGAGKSTLSAYVFSKLKTAGVNAELVTEFAKDKVWEENSAALANQMYMFGKQYFRMTRCEDKVDAIVTDSPLQLSAFYNKDPGIDAPLKELIRIISSRYTSLNYFLRRVKKYNPKGRLQTEAESDEYSIRIKEMLRSMNVDFKELDGNIMSADVIVDQALEALETASGKAEQ